MIQSVATIPTCCGYRWRSFYCTVEYDGWKL